MHLCIRLVSQSKSEINVPTRDPARPLTVPRSELLANGLFLVNYAQRLIPKNPLQREIEAPSKTRL
jgi:hypothetical protein